MLESFEKCVASGSADVSQHFLDAQTGLLQYGEYAAKLPRAIDRVSVFLQHFVAIIIHLSLCVGQATPNPR